MRVAFPVHENAGFMGLK